MNKFENWTLLRFKKMIEEKNELAIIYRLKQSRFCSQVCDLLVDSKSSKYYLAIECKHRKDKISLSFNGDFSESKEGGQLERLETFCQLSGRIGLIIFKARKRVVVGSLIQILFEKRRGEKSIGLKNKKIWKDIDEYFNEE